jgi:hypothetical protein
MNSLIIKRNIAIIAAYKSAHQNKKQMAYYWIKKAWQFWPVQEKTIKDIEIILNSCNN